MSTIVLVHGLWMTPRSWEHWIPHYEAKGHTVLTPAYPGFDVEVEALRADPTPIATATVPDTVGAPGSSARSRRARSRRWRTIQSARVPSWSPQAL